MSIGSIKNFRDLIFSSGTQILRIKLSDHVSKAADIVVSTLNKAMVHPFLLYLERQMYTCLMQLDVMKVSLL